MQNEMYYIRKVLSWRKWVFSFTKYSAIISRFTSQWNQIPLNAEQDVRLANKIKCLFTFSFPRSTSFKPIFKLSTNQSNLCQLFSQTTSANTIIHTFSNLMMYSIDHELKDLGLSDVLQFGLKLGRVKRRWNEEYTVEQPSSRTTLLVNLSHTKQCKQEN